MRSNVQIHAHILELELGVHQGVDTDATDTGLKTPHRERHAIADAEFSRLPVSHAHLRVLKHLGGGLGQQRHRSGAGQNQAVVAAG